MVSAQLLRGLPVRLPALPRSPAPPCTRCVEGKSRHQPHPPNPSRAAALLDKIHLDLWGLPAVQSRDGFSYALIIVDDISRYATVSLLRAKSEAPDHIQSWIRHASVRHSRSVREVVCDNGGELVSGYMRNLYHSLGIALEPSTPGNPEQNGVVERRIGTVTTIARCLWAHARPPPSLLSYCLLHAARLSNLWPHTLQPEVTPHELWFGDRPSAASLRIWGYVAHVLDERS